jgi:peptidoglycan/xylan/chitin deacetylase (PgdA/CDA1 family)/GT2 family glycosyltransferase
MRFSVIIPTYQRRELALALVRSLSRQEFGASFEVIVVVDGSNDGSACALREIEAPFQVTVLEQPNQGAAAARNRGAAVAHGELLLFLDDDMEAHPRLLAEHDFSHRAGADVVLGHIPLHPQSPPNILSGAVKGWTDERLKRLSSPEAALTLHDLLTGQLSLARELFYRIGGFDISFTFNGSFGDEDIDFGYRLMCAGCRIVFNPNAISCQNYVVQPRQYLAQWREAGRADVAFARKHPEQASTIFALNGADRWINRWIWRSIVAVPLLSSPLMAGLRSLALMLVNSRWQNAAVSKWFFEIRAMEYWRGVYEAGGMPRSRPLRVLAYHAIRDLAQAPVIESYAVPPERFRVHLDSLRQAGFRFVSAGEFLNFLHREGGLPRRPLLLTFDDGYEELFDVVLPMLKERRIPAIVFAVSGRLGGTNVWDEAIGAPQLRLLDAHRLRQLAQEGLEIGAHSRTHRALTQVTDEELLEEIKGSISDLEDAGLKSPRMFAYPEGDFDQRVQTATREAGLQAAFTVVAGRVCPDHDPYQIPRIEVMREDTGWRFLWKVINAGRLM